MLTDSTILAIDYGTVACGLAIFNKLSMPYPIPFGRILFKSNEQLILELKKIISSEDIGVLILGLPHFTDGKESEMTKKIKMIGLQIETELNIPLYFQDETLSTYEAENRMKSSAQYNFKIDPKQIDAVAATIILEDFLKVQGAIK